MSDVVRVLLVDDHPILVECLRRLTLSVKTVDTYRARAMAKLGLHRRVEVVAYALGHGLMDAG